jgi:hypothetical protein
MTFEEYCDDYNITEEERPTAYLAWQADQEVPVSTIEPGEGDDLLARLEAEMGDVDISDVEDVTKLEGGALLRQFALVERQLRDIGEMMQPHTDDGRELHSRRSAYLIEMRRRGMR